MWKKIWSDPVWSKVIAAAIIAGGGIAVTFFLGLWPVIVNGASSVTSYLGDSQAVPRWALLLLSVLSLPAIVLAAALFWARIRPSTTSPPPDWTSYTTDLFLGLRWRWKYTGTQMSEPLAFCPTCDYQIDPQPGFDLGSHRMTRFHCDSCAKDVANCNESYDQLSRKAARLAQMKIRNGTWGAAQSGT